VAETAKSTVPSVRGVAYCQLSAMSVKARVSCRLLLVPDPLNATYAMVEALSRVNARSASVVENLSATLAKGPVAPREIQAH